MATQARLQYHFLHVEQIEDPYENNIEAETDEFSKTVPISDSPDLATPKDQEEKFVNLLKKQYKGTFPEYARETKSDFSKNKELEDNLSVQPETVYFSGHSDKEKSNGLDDYPIPDETSAQQDNLATFDEDAKVLNSESLKLSALGSQHHSNVGETDNIQDTTTARPSHGRKHKTQSIEDILSEYNEYGDTNSDDGQSGIENTATTQDYEGQKSVSENIGNLAVTEKTGNENEHESANDNESEKMDDHVTDNVSTDEMESEHVSEHVQPHHETNHMTDDMDDNEADHMTDDDMKNHSEKEENKLMEKTKEEALWDSEEKLLEQNSRNRKHKKLREKKENLKEDQSEKILKDFDQIKAHNTGKPNRRIKETGKINEHNSKSNSQDEAGKHIQYVHADESQVSGDAILDFLDKLLEKDPKELKHDVLAMTKEMRKEGKLNISITEFGMINE